MNVQFRAFRGILANLPLCPRSRSGTIGAYFLNG